MRPQRRSLVERQIALKDKPKVKIAIVGICWSCMTPI